jgi:hypothetical protein
VMQSFETLRGGKEYWGRICLHREAPIDAMQQAATRLCIQFLDRTISMTMMTMKLVAPVSLQRHEAMASKTARAQSHCPLEIRAAGVPCTYAMQERTEGGGGALCQARMEMSTHTRTHTHMHTRTRTSRSSHSGLLPRGQRE